MFTNFVQRRRIYYLISAVVITLGIIAMIYSTIRYGSPVRLSIDFRGGSLFVVEFEDEASETAIREVYTDFGLDDPIIQQLGDPSENRWQIRAGTLAPDQQAALISAVLAAGLVVLGFIWFAFRKVSNPIRYGASAIIAMFHDVLVTMGVMSALGIFFGWEVDALFLTAMLTVVGFSVQDSIVVFDRIRENQPKYRHEDYETIVNRSVLETIHRSLATQLNAIFVMVAILLFGGATIKQFIAILLIGLLSGTYSSIFTAVPLLVSWEKGELPFVGRRA